jgi:hypothetical protein
VVARSGGRRRLGGLDIGGGGFRENTFPLEGPVLC